MSEVTVGRIYKKQGIEVVRFEDAIDALHNGVYDLVAVLNTSVPNLGERAKIDTGIDESYVPIYEEVFGRIDLDSDKEVMHNVQIIREAINLSSNAKSTLFACFLIGPLDDGCVPSKQGRDELIEFNFVEKTIHKGDWGYNACTYRGAYAYKVLVYLDKQMNIKQNKAG